ncbi:hypothetical protein GCM10027187_11530 [Streptosporangium sandarakinum]|uniref:Secreted protein n=1 Tax=Streptosporangium sandarakinum TaxID=1260955 RepID=A0A852UXQ7_9ACTN|nr:DUF5719 family protein [Streptosporangium sandarakinum]NYF39844.1 hypothetical protein [Streptosporangium sandarakinum]
MRALVERRPGSPRLVLAVLAGLAVLYGLAAATRPETAVAPAPAPRKVPVASVTAVCPDPGGSDVGVVTPPGGGGRGAAALVAGERTLATLTVPGSLWQEKLKAGSPPLVVTANGSMAAGLEAAQTRRETSGEQRGLAGTRCVEPGASAWLVGPGPAAADVTLHLANADLAPAGVEITVYSGEGPVAGGSGDTIVVEPGESRAIRLRDIAPSPLVMAVEVSTAFGRVTAAAHAVMSGGRGVDWLPLSADPATRVVVPGVPGGGGRRDLLVASPAETDTIVEVRVVTPDGTYALDGHDAIEVPAGSVAAMDLSAGLDGRPAAVLLTSPVPIVAAVTATGTGDRVDVGFTAGAAPIDLGSVVADNRTGGKKSSRLVFSAPETAGRVSVTMLPRKGKAPEPIEVEILAARTKEVELPDVDGAFAVVAEPLPGSGPVYGARVMDERLKDGRVLTVQPLAAARVWAVVPPVTGSAATVLP